MELCIIWIADRNNCNRRPKCTICEIMARAGTVWYACDPTYQDSQVVARCEPPPQSHVAGVSPSLSERRDSGNALPVPLAGTKLHLSPAAGARGGTRR